VPDEPGKEGKMHSPMNTVPLSDVYNSKTRFRTLAFRQGVKTMKSQHRILSLGLAGALLAAFVVPAPRAQAGDRTTRAIIAGALIGGTLGYIASDSHHHRSRVHVGVGYSMPLYVGPSYYHSPVYYSSPVVYSRPPVYYSAPVVYSPPPVYYSSPVVYYQPSVITTSISCTRPRIIQTRPVRPVIIGHPHSGGHYNRITCPRR
jgi:hypothetical protein